jgi:hypothetical protein
VSYADYARGEADTCELRAERCRERAAQLERAGWRYRRTSRLGKSQWWHLWRAWLRALALANYYADGAEIWRQVARTRDALEQSFTDERRGVT